MRSGSGREAGRPIRRSSGGRRRRGTPARPTWPRSSHGCGGKLTFARCLPASRLPLLMVDKGEKDAGYTASLMPNARLEQLPSGWMTADTEVGAVNGPRLDAVARLIGLQPRPVVPDSILSTILFTDVVESTS